MEKLSPKAVWIFFFSYFWVGLIPAFILTGLALLLIANTPSSSFLDWQIIFFLIIWFLGSYGWAKLFYNAYKFEIAAQAFKQEYGVIWKKYTAIPYQQIQNIDIHRGILCRILGLSDLTIQTAGYSSGSLKKHNLPARLSPKETEGRLVGLSKKRAEEIRDELIKKVK